MQDIRKMTIEQKESMKPTKKSLYTLTSLFSNIVVFCTNFFFSNGGEDVAVFSAACLFSASFSYKNLPFIIQEAAVLIMYLVEVHSFSAATTVYWIIWLVCVCMCVCAPNVFFPRRTLCSYFLRSSTSFTFSLTRISFFSFHSFTWLSLNHFGDSRHIQLYLRECEFIEYINNRFLFAFVILSLFTISAVPKLRTSLTSVVCMHTAFFLLYTKIILRAGVRKLHSCIILRVCICICVQNKEIRRERETVWMFNGNIFGTSVWLWRYKYIA